MDEEMNNFLFGVSKYGVGKWINILEDLEFKFNGWFVGDFKD